MASPFQSSDRSSSSPRSTPSRSLPNGNQRVNGSRPYRVSLEESPSRQLLEEFGRMLINDDRAFHKSLDEQTAVQQKLHIQALDRALAKHEEVRESAERARERVELEIEREHRRREEEEKKAVEKARRDLEEQKLAEQRRQLEESKAREEERRKQEALKREEEDHKRDADARKQREAEQSRQRAESQKQQEAAETSRKAAQEQSERVEVVRRSFGAQDGQSPQLQRQSPAVTQQPAASTSQTNGVSSAHTPTAPRSQAPSGTVQASQLPTGGVQGLVSSKQDREAVHRQYLDLHKRLKQMRVQVSEEVKKIPGLKNQLSDWRRAIQKCCGQLGKAGTEDVKASNRRVVSRHQNQSCCILHVN